MTLYWVWTLLLQVSSPTCLTVQLLKNEHMEKLVTYNGLEIKVACNTLKVRLWEKKKTSFSGVYETDLFNLNSNTFNFLLNHVALYVCHRLRKTSCIGWAKGENLHITTVPAVVLLPVVVLKEREEFADCCLVDSKIFSTSELRLVVSWNLSISC